MDGDIGRYSSLDKSGSLPDIYLGVIMDRLFEPLHICNIHLPICVKKYYTFYSQLFTISTEEFDSSLITCAVSTVDHMVYEYDESLWVLCFDTFYFADGIICRAVVDDEDFMVSCIKYFNESTTDYCSFVISFNEEHIIIFTVFIVLLSWGFTVTRC